ncbi:MAG TPA: DUF305 domain-containing protein [Alphaproteobacteria bacterium]|nr:DUF305 domain-containing protein [Rhodospirillaceae bacterium]HRJ66955.1 DUF305 domain-containing protein [Alphaproteobacteria bacterium]
MKRHLFMAMLAVAGLSNASLADQHNLVHSQHQEQPAQDADTKAPADVYADAMEKMHHDMAIAPTGDADIDFARGMIPHHQGAIDMAKIVLEKGKDAEIRKLAEDIIAAQEKEIAFLQGWLDKNAAAKSE